MVIVKRGDAQVSGNALVSFTFQYGYSKTIDVVEKVATSFSFTFQYGYSKTFILICLILWILYLHSSMVIVKQFGKNMTQPSKLYLHSSMVIVKLLFSFKFSATKHIYIPVWL